MTNLFTLENTTLNIYSLTLSWVAIHKHFVVGIL